MKGLDAMANYRNDLKQFIYEHCFDDILQAASAYLAMHPTALDLSFSRIKYPDFASILSLIPQFATNITIAGDKLSFDAVMSGIIELSEETYADVKRTELNQWLRISCIAVITDKLDSLVVDKIVTYKKGEDDSKEGVAASSNIVPIVHKDELALEAEAFLTEHYSKALEEPCPVPILDIARDELHLNVIQGKCITEDFSILGKSVLQVEKLNYMIPSNIKKKKQKFPEGPLSYKLVHNGRIGKKNRPLYDLAIDEVEGPIIQEIFHLVAHEGYGTYRASNYLNEKYPNPNKI